MKWMCGHASLDFCITAAVPCEWNLFLLCKWSQSIYRDLIMMSIGEALHTQMICSPQQLLVQDDGFISDTQVEVMRYGTCKSNKNGVRICFDGLSPSVCVSPQTWTPTQGHTKGATETIRKRNLSVSPWSTESMRLVLNGEKLVAEKAWLPRMGIVLSGMQLCSMV